MTEFTANICDCHMHVFDVGYPLAPTATFKPPHAPASAYREVQCALGLSRVVVVQPTGYGFDNSCTLAAMDALGPAARGVVVVAPDIATAELERLHRIGVRGVRFMMLAGGVLPWSSLKTIAARIAPLGWHINLQLDGCEFPQRESMLTRLPCNLVIDHIGKFLAPVDNDSESFASLCRLLDGKRTWIKISAPYETSLRGAPDYEDIVPRASALAERYPQRCLWASNWPHPNTLPPPSNTALFEWARRCVGDDAHWKKMLIDNPAEFYGFT